MTTTSTIPSTPALWPDGQLVLPPLLSSVVRSLEANLALPPTVGTAVALQAVSAAIGAAAVLRDDPAPPLTSSLHTIIAAGAGSTLPLALDVVLAPLRIMQAELNALAATGPAMLAAEPRLRAMEQRACLTPVILVEDAQFSALLAAPPRAFDRCVLATYPYLADSTLLSSIFGGGSC